VPRTIMDVALYNINIIIILYYYYNMHRCVFGLWP